MRLGQFEIENPLILGPMAGVTDWAFRTVCAELGANITVTEMVSSRALVYRIRRAASFCGKMKAVSAVPRFLETIPPSWQKLQ